MAFPISHFLADSHSHIITAFVFFYTDMRSLLHSAHPFQAPLGHNRRPGYSQQRTSRGVLWVRKWKALSILISVRAKMSLSWAQNIFMPKKINSVVLLTNLGWAGRENIWLSVRMSGQSSLPPNMMTWSRAKYLVRPYHSVNKYIDRDFFLKS